MKLTYRGTAYEYEPVVVDLKTGEIGGVYRSQSWQNHNLVNPPVLLPKTNLTYRGVNYSTQGSVTAEELEAERSNNLSTEAKARSLMMNRTQDIKKRQRVMLTRLASEIGLDAQEHWTHIQGQVQPTFRVNYNRYGTAMS